MSEIQCDFIVRVLKKHANSVLQILRAHNLLDTRYQIFQDHQHLFIPTIRRLSSAVRAEMQEYELEIIDDKDSKVWGKLRYREQREKTTLKEALKKIIPAKFHDIMPRSFDQIGTIAIIEVNRGEQLSLRPYIKQIADTLLHLHPHLESVYEKAGDVSGVYRIRGLKFVSGKENSVAVYKENNYRFMIDVESTFFTPRLAFERQRISSIPSPFTSYGWTWDMFCGVGPFLIQIAGKNPAQKYIGTDINPNAIDLAKKNIRLAKLTSEISFHCLDVKEIRSHDEFAFMKHQVSRIIMNLPEKNLDFIPLLPEFIHHRGALLHIYQFNEKQNPLEDAQLKLMKKLEESNLKIDHLLSSRIVKPYSPALDTTVIDVVINHKKSGI